MTDNYGYVYTIAKLDTAAQLGLLTKKGTEVLEKLRIAYADAEGHDGELSPLGGRQHQEIARRMYTRFPQLLSQPIEVDAESSPSGRCVKSMSFFCGELKDLNPELHIHTVVDTSHISYIIGNFDLEIEPGPDMPALEKKTNDMEKTLTNSRLLKSLFTDVSKAKEFIKPIELIGSLFEIASDLTNLPELGLSLMDVFTKEELFGFWKYANAAILVDGGFIPGSSPTYLYQVEARDSIVALADRVISDGKPALTLRFSHDGTILPLCYLMGFKEAMGGHKNLKTVHKSISIDKLIPMAANIQLVFYRKEGSDDILLKFLLNENETSLPIPTDIPPYYHWTDVKSCWENWR